MLVLVVEDNPKAVVLLLWTYRDDKAILRGLCERADRLPLVLEEALAAQKHVGVNLRRFSSLARGLFVAGTNREQAERAQLAGWDSPLISFAYYAPENWQQQGCRQASIPPLLHPVIHRSFNNYRGV